jgi:hypothetical protein
MVYRIALIVPISLCNAVKQDKGESRICLTD